MFVLLFNSRFRRFALGPHELFLKLLILGLCSWFYSCAIPTHTHTLRHRVRTREHTTVCLLSSQWAGSTGECNELLLSGTKSGNVSFKNRGAYPYLTGTDPSKVENYKGCSRQVMTITKYRTCLVFSGPGVLKGLPLCSWEFIAPGNRNYGERLESSHLFISFLYIGIWWTNIHIWRIKYYKR